MTADLSLLFNLTAFTLRLKSLFLFAQGNISRNTKFFVDLCQYRCWRTVNKL